MRILRFVAIVLIALVLAAVGGSLIFNALTSDPNVPVQELWHGGFVDGTAYRDWGSGHRDVVLVGGFLEPSFVWQGVGPILARAGYHVYAVDLDGFGYTVRHGPWTLAHWGDQVQRFIRAAHLRKPVVVGHSLGAAIAVEEARRGVASRAVLLDGDALRSGGPPGWLRSGLARSPFFTTLYRLVLDSNWVIGRVLKNAYGPVHPPIDAAQIHRWTDQFRAQDARRALQGIAQNGIAGFTRADLETMRIRARVVWGAHDTVDSASAGRQTAHDLHARFVEVPNAGHLSMLSAAPQVAAAIAR